MRKCVSITGWVARDEDGSIHLFETNPERVAECAWAEYPGHTLGIALPKDSFPSVTWDTEPVKATVLVSASEDGHIRTQWVSVKERLPEYGDICLCAAFGEGIYKDCDRSFFTAQFIGVDQWEDPSDGTLICTPQWMESWDNLNRCMYSDEVTHWMPIPEIHNPV